MSDEGGVLDRSLARIAAALRTGETSVEALIAEAVARHAAAGARLQAYQTWDATSALAEARSVDVRRRGGLGLPPLAGMPISVKDLFGLRGYPTYAGTARRLPDRWEREGTLVRALRAQLAVVVGKTKMVELAFGGLGNNPHWGTPVNPWDAAVHRVPGGSSSGAGVSLWEGSAVVALGTDTACSIRVPASMTGTVGHKITHGRWAADGMVPLSPTLDVVGGLTRSVEDAAYFFGAMDAHHGVPETFLKALARDDLSGVRIGIGGTHLWTECQDDIARVVRDALGELESRGARLLDLELPEFDAAYELYSTGIIAASECVAFVEAELPDWMDGLHDAVRQRLAAAVGTTAREYHEALSRRRALVASAARRLHAFDVMATPTVCMTPPALSEIEDPDGYTRLNRMTSRATNPVNMLDLCAISIPCGLDSWRMPVGLQLVSGNYADELLLSIALEAERTLGTARQRIGFPPIIGSP